MTAANEAARPSLVARVVQLSVVPLTAVISALAVGAIIILLSSLIRGAFDPLLPLNAYGALFSGAFGSLRGILFSIVSATPLILGGMAVGLASRPASSTSVRRASS